jgi:hypothetical protein
LKAFRTEVQPAATTGTGLVAMISPNDSTYACKGHLNHIGAAFNAAAHCPQDVVVIVDNRRDFREIPRIDMRDDGQSNAVRLAPPSLQGSPETFLRWNHARRAKLRRHPRRAAGLLRLSQGLDNRVVSRKCHRLDDQRDLSGMRRPSALAIPLSIVIASGLPSTSLRIVSGTFTRPLQPFLVADEVIHRDRAEPSGRMREQPVQADLFGQIHPEGLEAGASLGKPNHARLTTRLRL